MSEHKYTKKDAVEHPVPEPVKYEDLKNQPNMRTLTHQKYPSQRKNIRQAVNEEYYEKHGTIPNWNSEGSAYAGETYFVNPETGESVRAQRFITSVTAADFDKLFLSSFIATMEHAGNKTAGKRSWGDSRLGRFCRILNLRDHNGIIKMTQVEIAKKIGTDRHSVMRTIQDAIKMGLIARRKRGEYIVNPKIIWWGREEGGRKTAIINEFHESKGNKKKENTIKIIEAKQTTLEEQIERAQEEERQKEPICG